MKLNDNLKKALCFDYGCTLHTESFNSRHKKFLYEEADFAVAFVFDGYNDEFMYHQFYTKDYEGFEYFDDSCFTKKLRQKLKDTFAEMYMLMVKHQEVN